MDFNLSATQRSWGEKASALGRELPPAGEPAAIVKGAARAGLLDPEGDFISAVVAAEALACESASSGMVFALHTSALLALASARERVDSLVRGETVGALSLSTEDVPSQEDGKLAGRASWVGPITEGGIAIVGARRDNEICACAVPLDAAG